MATDRHICSVCKDEFLTLEEYVEHNCPETGFTPADPEHQGPEYAAIQKAALERGRENLEDPGAIARQDEAIASVAQSNVAENPAPADEAEVG